MNKLHAVLLTALLLAFHTLSFAGSIFVSAHDAVWHSRMGPNNTGAKNIATTAITYVRDGSTLPFLFVESISTPVPGGNNRVAPFLITDLGFSTLDFDVADGSILSGFSDFRSELNNYSAIVVASDHGGMLTSSELSFLNGHSDDIIAYLNSGGGLAAFAESNAKGLIGTEDLGCRKSVLHGGNSSS